MEQLTDARALVERGNDLLFGGNVTEAAMEFTRAVQADGSLAAAHLGVAEANFALAAYGVVSIACRKVLDLAPGTAEAAIAQALLYVLDRRYDAAISELEQAERLQPGIPYVHALRGYCWRQLGNKYDAASAEAKAARLASSRELRQLFPQPTSQAAVMPYPANGSPFTPPQQPQRPVENDPGVPGRIAYRDQRNWSRASQMQRRATRVGFATRGAPTATIALIIINVIIFGIGYLSPGLNQTLINYGAEQGSLIAADPTQAYRILTAMFLHAGFTHIFFNMISLYSVGIITETIFGKGRYLLIYFGAGIAGGILQAVVSPAVPAVGASGAIFGIFGAFGAFALLLRDRLGPAGSSAIAQWVFFLILNLVLGFTLPGIGIWDHIGGLVVGFVLGAIFVQQSQRRRRVF